MPINNLPTALQSIIQQNFLQREFMQALRPMMGYRRLAERRPFGARIGETITMTRAGLLGAITTPLAPASNTDFTSGLTAQNWATEQFTLGINQYAANQMVNLVTSQVDISNLFLQNARTLAEQAAFSVETLAATAIYQPYMGGNTFVATTLGAAGTTIDVDNINGFQYALNNEGQPVPVSSTYPINVVVGTDTYSLVSAVASGTNTSTTPYGVSGTLTFSTSVTVADGTAGNAVTSSVGSRVVRPYANSNGAMAATTSAFAATPGDYDNNAALTMKQVEQAMTNLRMNNVRPLRSGKYLMLLSPQQMMGLYSDPAFQYLYRGVPGAAPFTDGDITEMPGVTLKITNISPIQTVSGNVVQRGLVAGEGALVEGVYTDVGYRYADMGADMDMITIAEGIAHITREPLDALKQVVTQTWSYIGGFVAPTDVTTNPTTLPTATNAYYKRAVVVESL